MCDDWVKAPLYLRQHSDDLTRIFGFLCTSASHFNLLQVTTAAPPLNLHDLLICLDNKFWSRTHYSSLNYIENYSCKKLIICVYELRKFMYHGALLPPQPKIEEYKERRSYVRLLRTFIGKRQTSNNTCKAFRWAQTNVNVGNKLSTRYFIIILVILQFMVELGNKTERNRIGSAGNEFGWCLSELE